MKNIKLIKNMILSGVNNLYNNHIYIDKLNVFPVPDGDTGTNMNLTSKNAFKEVENLEIDNIYEFVKVFAKKLVLNARGNSGVIFSQFFKGISLGINKGTEHLATNDWVNCFLKSKETTYNAVLKPVEGTMLTISSDLANYASNVVSNVDIKTFWTNLIKVANVSLNNTPNLLPILKEAGVVDSGAYGLVKFLEGMNEVIQKNKIIKIKSYLEENTGNNIELEHEKEYGYCTEALIQLNNNHISNLQKNVIADKLSSFNNKSIVVVSDDDILKIHTHADRPGIALDYLQQFGDFKNIKVENMTLQANKHLKDNDSVDDKNTDNRKLKNDLAIIMVVQNQKMKDYFENEAGVQYAIIGGEKMNPSTNDIINAIKHVDAKDVILLPNNKNIILTAQQSSKIEKKSNVHIVETKNIQEGMAVICNLDTSLAINKMIANAYKIIKNITSLDITIADKDLIKSNVKKNDYLVLLNNKIMPSKEKLEDLANEYLIKNIKNKEIVTIFVGKNAKNSEIKFIEDTIKNNDLEYEFIKSNQEVYNFLILIE